MLAILSVLIIVHECGHFLVARLFGFQTPVFGFGLPFGPHWVIGKRWGTEFRFHAFVLGGYVAIPELGDESNATQDAFGVPLKPFRKFPIWQRALVAFAGVGFNILFAWLVMFTMFVTLGQPSQPVVIHALIKDNPIAMQAGIKEGDELVAIDNVKIASPEDAVRYLTNHKNTTVDVTLLRPASSDAKVKKSEEVNLKMTTNADGKVGMALIPKGPISYKPVVGNIFEIAGHAAVKLWALTFSMLDALGQMFSSMFQGMFSGGKAPAGKPAVGIGDLHGVLAVVKIGADIARQDWSQLFLFTIMISMDLAIINLLPWPALDGGHLAFMAFEAVRGRPMGERAQGEIVKWGFVSLILLMVVIMVNDVSALMQGKLDFKMKSKEESTDTGGSGAKPSENDSAATPAGQKSAAPAAEGAAP